MHIRAATETDFPAYRTLCLEALRDHPLPFSSDYAVNEAYPDRFWLGRLRALGELGMLYLAMIDGEPVGMCGVQCGDSPKTRHAAMKWGVYVHSGQRGLRIAEQLIERCVEWARQNGRR